MEEPKNYTVYMHINKINNKKYIGITKTSVNKRWGCNGTGYRDNKQSVFYRAIQKYGWDNFEHKILYENLSQDEACNIEVKLIKEYKTQNKNFGYNVQPGGQLGNSGITFSDSVFLESLSFSRIFSAFAKNPCFFVFGFSVESEILYSSVVSLSSIVRETRVIVVLL